MESPTSHTAWIKASDFIETKIKVRLENSTTQTTIPDGRVDLSLIEPPYLTFTIPSGCCAFGHMLMIQLHQYSVSPFQKGEMAGCQHTFTGKVIEEMSLGNGIKSVTVHLLQFDEKELASLASDVERQQKRVNQIVERIRG